MAQPPQPKPGPAHEQLSVFVGHWNTEGELKTGESGAAAKIRSVDIYEWLPGGFFVAHRWDSQVGAMKVQGLEIIGHDPASGAYRTHFFDSQGGSGEETLTVRDRTWIWEGRNVMGVAAHRCTSVVNADGNQMTATHERSDDGINWKPWMEVTLTRVAQP
jgi:hypothetical protein